MNLYGTSQFIKYFPIYYFNSGSYLLTIMGKRAPCLQPACKDGRQLRSSTCVGLSRVGHGPKDRLASSAKRRVRTRIKTDLDVFVQGWVLAYITHYNHSGCFHINDLTRGSQANIISV